MGQTRKNSMPNWPKSSPPDRGVAVISYNPLPYSIRELASCANQLRLFFRRVFAEAKLAVKGL